MIVIDASAVVELLLQGPRADRLAARIRAGGSALHAPELVVLEVVQVFRKARAAGRLTKARAQLAFDALLELRMQRYTHAPLLERVWSLRDNLSAYDATYVALAESLDVPLLTLDAGMAKAARHRAKVEVLR
ncbi:MAG TPA: type II toxin-antitoxin system VapC family toxin [Polyangiales bacterium]|nr:type II toxin-antitoxin system VapC family toxin [Polyangiales bacterium]